MSIGRNTWACICFWGLLTSAAQATETLVDIAGPTGTGFKALLTTEPPVPALAVALLLPGGKGDFKFKSGPDGVAMANGARLPNRLRTLLLQRGVVSYLVDAPADVPELSDSFRASARHLQDLQTLILAARRTFPGLPVVVVGHSNGTLSAAHLAAAYPADVSGVVLVAGRLVHINYSDTFFNADGLSRFAWTGVQSPLLAIHHRWDDCFATPYSGASKLVDDNPRFTLLTVNPSGASANGKCSYDGTHNLTGQESLVADGIAQWVKTAALK